MCRRSEHRADTTSPSTDVHSRPILDPERSRDLRGRPARVDGHQPSLYRTSPVLMPRVVHARGGTTRVATEAANSRQRHRYGAPHLRSLLQLRRHRRMPIPSPPGPGGRAGYSRGNVDDAGGVPKPTRASGNPSSRLHLTDVAPTDAQPGHDAARAQVGAGTISTARSPTSLMRTVCPCFLVAC